MARNGIITCKMTFTSFSPYMALLFFLLIVMADDQQHSFPEVTSRVEATNENTSQSTNKIQIPHLGRKVGPHRVHRSSSSPWRRERIFKAGAHEVPSGPNPISNSSIQSK
ncbi:unnamed protein product [Ilex paraguariensis]|uniref:Uncharacterized protein n=1 Tax=Ilex paraguariensis TaxID=185542 RepID=A0ABC8V2K5_9AQUA